MNALLRGIGAGLVMSLGLVSGAAAVDFYQGKTVNFVIGYPVGGGYDTYSRLIAAHLGEHLAGHPSVIPLNMPGAVTIRATNYLYNEAPKDGTVIGMIDQAIYLNQILGTSQLRADATRFTWIGRIVSNSAVLYAWHLSPVKKIEDTFARELIVAAGGVSSRLNWLVLNSVVGTKLKLISGYPGTGEERIAMERGEIEAMSQPWPIIKTELAQWLDEKKISLLVQTGVDKNAGLTAVPRMIDLAKNDEDGALLRLFSTPSTIGRAVVAPPGLPAPRVAELRRAFVETLRDPALLRDLERARLDIEPLPGEELQAAIASSGKFSPELIARAQRIAEARN
jgi:tripartite-type tricarboxylate transporter receptor subunit TctC